MIKGAQLNLKTPLDPEPQAILGADVLSLDGNRTRELHPGL